MKFHSILLAVFLTGGQLASAATTNLSVGANSTIRSTVGNQGTSQELQVGDTTTSGDFIRSALAFNLSSFTNVIINSATLTLTVRITDSTSQNATMTLNLHQLTSSFTTADVTWTNRTATDTWTTLGGDFGGVLASATGNPRTAAAGTAVSFSGTDFTTAAQSATGGVFYLLAKSDVENNAARNLFRFASSRDTTTSYHPYLTLDYTIIPEPSSAALLLMFAPVAFFLRRRR